MTSRALYQTCALEGRVVELKLLRRRSRVQAVGGGEKYVTLRSWKFPVCGSNAQLSVEAVFVSVLCRGS